MSRSDHIYELAKVPQLLEDLDSTQSPTFLEATRGRIRTAAFRGKAQIQADQRKIRELGAKVQTLERIIRGMRRGR